MDTRDCSRDAFCDGGDLDCGSGLLLIIRKAMTPLSAGQILEVRSTESSVREDLPAWCRLVGHDLASVTQASDSATHFLIRKKLDADASLQQDMARAKTLSFRVRIRCSSGNEAQAFARNHIIDIGQAASFDTEDKFPSAVEYLLAALGGCLAVGFRWRASQRNIPVANLEITLQAKSSNILAYLGMEDGDPGFEEVTVRAYIESQADSEILQSLFRETVNRSPVAQTILRTSKLNLSVRETS